MQEFITRLQLLMGMGIKLSVFTDPDEYTGEHPAQLRSGFAVCCEKTLPSQEEIDAVDASLVSNALAGQARAAKEAIALKDLGVLASFRVMQQLNPDLTFSEFVDQL